MLDFPFLSLVTFLNPPSMSPPLPPHTHTHTRFSLSISSSSLYSPPVPSQAENRFLNRQDSGDQAEYHYWPHLGSIATTMASLDNRIDSVMDTKA